MIEFDPNLIIQSETPMDCGLATIEFVAGRGKDPLDEEIFEVDYSTLPHRLIVRETDRIKAVN